MDTSGDNKYVYEPLSYDYERCQPIRLLRILPGQLDTPICWEIFSTYIRTSEDPQIPTSNIETLKPQPRTTLANASYNALSYTWGNAEERGAIRVDGKVLSITRNLWIFLDRHRETFLTKRKVQTVLWVDAICIDQGNVKERSKQVAFMADIFGEAKMVLVWLREGDSDSRMAFKTIQSRNLEKLSIAESKVLASTAVLKGGYWDGLWIVQEIFHARRITVRCSTLKVDWGDLIKAIRGEQGATPHRLQILKMSPFGELGYDVFSMLGHKGCLDPRDAVYGLRSMAPSLMTLVSDYSLSTADVFTAATRAVIKDLDYMIFLDALVHEKPPEMGLSRIEGLPSWVKDFRMGSGYYHKLLKSTVLEKARKQLQDWLPECKSIIESLFDQRLDGNMDYLRPRRLLDECARHTGFDIPTPASTPEFFLDKVYPLSALARNAIVITKSGYRGFVLGKPPKVNDLVFVAYGARFPYVLRQAEGNETECFSLIGNAWIEGLMEEEALELCDAGKLTEQVISLV
ncbi:hypothetical protein N431DRAFT_551311 [Stipitochalara longipes BDJ]|nr:hypothetical protein N431DRAFT_551311 [Stipitochalara longipes BDJ]